MWRWNLANKLKPVQVLLFVAIVLIAVGVNWQKFAKQPVTPVTNTIHISGPGGRCGGNMTTAPTCSVGYHCAPEPGSHLPFGDVGGICTQD